VEWVDASGDAGGVIGMGGDIFNFTTTAAASSLQIR
jgi:hypothetical protein